METAFSEHTEKPVCVDRHSAYRAPYRAAEVIRHEPSREAEKPPAEKRTSPVFTGKQRPSGTYHKPQEAATASPAAPAAPADRAGARPQVTKNSSLVLWLSAICGIAAGMVSGNAVGTDSLLMNTDGSFLLLFLCRLLYTGIFLLAEYVMGYFALGEWLVWLVPLCCGMGTGVFAAAAITEGKAKLLPAALVSLAAVVGGARRSGEFSAQLLRVVSGSRTGIVLTEAAAKDYTMRFFGCIAAAAAAALYEAAVKLG